MLIMIVYLPLMFAIVVSYMLYVNTKNILRSNKMNNNMVKTQIFAEMFAEVKRFNVEHAKEVPVKVVSSDLYLMNDVA